jgi:hypothetical protein
MDRLETWEVPFTSTWEQTGSSGRRLNKDPGPDGPLRPTGSASCETRTKEDRVDPGSEANKRPDRRDGKS